MNKKFAVTELQNKHYRKFAKKNGIPVGHANDPRRSNLNLDRASFILKKMKKKGLYMEEDEGLRRGHLDSYFTF